ncbi:MAG: cobyrinate a,c-diamide synthase [Candidatus Fimadaptatus sp.]|jgi:cobyrinic acid a,c-diamide synthase
MRLMIAGASSGCGKTTVTLALMAALREGGARVAPFKTGPDYIDPGFHAVACGRPSHNLDAHLLSWDSIRYLLSSYGADADISVIEGVMGFYDGSDAVSLRCSSYELARETATPVLLAVDAAGGAASVAAQVLGFQRMTQDNTIAGVIVNRASSAHHYELVRAAVKHYTGLPCVGWLRKDARLRLDSRHLGLVPADELPQLRAQLGIAAELAREGLDMPMIERIAAGAPQLPRGECEMTRYLGEHPRVLNGMRIGVPRDEAFGFYYQACLDALRMAGAELVEFSPMRDAGLPQGINALYIGGGFPEVFSEQLEGNASMRGSVRAALEGGMRCYAECGGLIYLSRSMDGRAMTGFLPVECRMTGRLQRFGYVEVRDESGLSFPAHEFHHSLAEPVGEVRCAFDICRPTAPDRHWQCGYARLNALAGFPHIHFWSRPELMVRLLGRA